MKVQILQVFVDEKTPHPVVEFATRLGSGRAGWYGPPPSIQHSYEVELAVEEELAWGANVVETQDRRDAIEYRDGALIVQGQLEMLDPDQPAVMRVGPSIVVMEVEGGVPPGVGAWIRVQSKCIVLYPHDHYGILPQDIRYERPGALAALPPVTRPGDRITLTPGIIQPEDVFTPDTYYRFLAPVRQKRHERDKLGDLIFNKYETTRERLDSPEEEQLEAMEWELVLLMREYIRRLPIHLFARCPYCGMHILQPLDSFSLLGLAPGFDTRKLYYKYQWVESPRPRQRCRHALLATVAVNLYGRRPDDLPAWALTAEWDHLSVGPRLMVWPLVARRTSAVVHALPIGRLDDPEPIHRYTAYVVTYFYDDGSNLGSEEMWVPNSEGGPAMGAVQIDPDLVKWLRAGRLYWLDPASPSELLSGPEEAFPYAGIQPQGWYTIVAGGHLYGPRPYASTWQGQAPPHDESFPRSVEPLEG